MLPLGSNSKYFDDRVVRRKAFIDFFSHQRVKDLMLSILSTTKVPSSDQVINSADVYFNAPVDAIGKFQESFLRAIHLVDLNEIFPVEDEENKKNSEIQSRLLANIERNFIIAVSLTKLLMQEIIQVACDFYGRGKISHDDYLSLHEPIIEFVNKLARMSDSCLLLAVGTGANDIATITKLKELEFFKPEGENKLVIGVRGHPESIEDCSKLSKLHTPKACCDADLVVYSNVSTAYDRQSPKQTSLLKLFITKIFNIYEEYFFGNGRT